MAHTISQHWIQDRSDRANRIRAIGGTGNIIARVNIDRGHPNGPEIHCITDNAMIIVYNAWSGKQVTTMIARPGQLRRYGINIPNQIIVKAQQHQKMGYNY